MSVRLAWLLEENTFNEEAHPKLITAIRDRKMDVETIKYAPFGYGSYDQYFRDRSYVMCMGSLNFIKRIRREKPRWWPNSWCNLPAFKCSTYYAHWGKYLLNSDYTMVPMGDLPRLQEAIYAHFAQDDCIFIRPDRGDKTFTGNVLPREDFDKVYDHIKDFCEPTDLVIISSPKKVEEEWRFIIANHEVVTASQYRSGRWNVVKAGAPDEAIQFVEMIAKTQFAPDPMYSLDICKSNGCYRLLEIGSFSCSGLYACDVDKMVQAVVDWVEEEARKAEQDK